MLSAADILALSSQHAKNAAELLIELLARAKDDFRKDPFRYQAAVDEILAARRLLERNVNPQMILDVLFLKLNARFARSV
jgi:hypothetical protein